MPEPILARYEETGYSASLIPFRCLMAAQQPACQDPIIIESVEVRATCPDGWHESPTFYAKAGLAESSRVSLVDGRIATDLFGGPAARHRAV